MTFKRFSSNNSILEQEVKQLRQNVAHLQSSVVEMREGNHFHIYKNIPNMKRVAEAKITDF
jgi:hypothetical protein